jgi:hypothetical protein
MSCPDELTRDLWAAHALPHDEASAVAEHVAGCSMCSAQRVQSDAFDASLGAALDLDHAELDFLASLDLAATWRASTATASDGRWGWLALLGVVAAFFAWSAAAQPFGNLVGIANLVGLGSVLLTTGVGMLLGVSQALIGVSTNPVLGYSQPLLAVLALALLFWPRIKSAPRYLQGVRS